jgi:hypothetical protein
LSTALSGVNANVKLGATDYDAQGWTADYTVNVFDSTTTADLGWDDETAATQRFEGSFDIFYNPTKKPTPALTPGTVITQLSLYVSTITGDVFQGKALVKGLGLKSKTKEGFTVNVKFVNKGPWTVPS